MLRAFLRTRYVESLGAFASGTLDRGAMHLEAIFGTC